MRGHHHHNNHNHLHHQHYHHHQQHHHRHHLTWAFRIIAQEMPGQIFTHFFIISITNTISSIIIIIVFIIRQLELLLASIYRPFNHYCLFIDPRWGWSMIIYDNDDHDDFEDTSNMIITLAKRELICMIILAMVAQQPSFNFPWIWSWDSGRTRCSRRQLRWSSHAINNISMWVWLWWWSLLW